MTTDAEVIFDVEINVEEESLEPAVETEEPAISKK